MLNTTYAGTGQVLDPLYMPRNPRYLYPERYKAKNTYETGLSHPSYFNLLPEKDPLSAPGIDDLMLRKEEVIDSKIRMLMSEIYQRRKLQDENLANIDLNECTCRTLIYRMRVYGWEKRRIDMERKIIELEEEKRKEQTGYFRDILFLKKELRDTLIEKLEEEQKLALFRSQQEESR